MLLTFPFLFLEQQEIIEVTCMLQRRGGPSEGWYQGNPGVGSYDKQTPKNNFNNRILSNLLPPPPYIPLPQPAIEYTSNVSPPHPSQLSRHFVHDHNVVNLTRLSSTNHEIRHAYSPYHSSLALVPNYNLSNLNNVWDGMGYNSTVHNYGNNSPPTHLPYHVGWVIQCQTFLMIHN